MKRAALVLASAVAVVVLVLGLSGTLYSQQGQEVKIGVVDLKQVSERFDKWLKKAREIEDQGKAVDAELGKMEAEITKLQQKLDDKIFAPGTKEHTDLQIEVSKLRIEQKSFYERKSRELRALAEKQGTELLGNIEDVIKQYGRVNGFTLIIKKEEAPMLGGKWGWDELRSYVSRKAVMYYDTNIDLTDQIVKVLNQKFK